MMMLIFVLTDSCDNLVSVFQHSIEENYPITRLIDFCFFWGLDSLCAPFLSLNFNDEGKKTDG